MEKGGLICVSLGSVYYIMPITKLRLFRRQKMVSL
jgi:hypothetical protein